jgi:ankyrin repeat protein
MDPSDIERAIQNLPQEQARVLECLAALFPSNLDVNERRHDGDTAIFGAASNHYPEVIDFLVQHGAKVDLRNKNGDTPLMAAGAGRRAERTKLSPEAIATIATLKKLGAVE